MTFAWAAFVDVIESGLVSFVPSKPKEGKRFAQSKCRPACLLRRASSPRWFSQGKWLLARSCLVAAYLAISLALPAGAQTRTTTATANNPQQTSQNDKQKKTPQQKPQAPVKLRVPVQVLQPAGRGQPPGTTTAPSGQQPGIMVPPTNRQPGANQPPPGRQPGTIQPPTNRQPVSPPPTQPQTPIYVPQQPAPTIIQGPPTQIIRGHCATTQGRMAGFLISLTAWDDKKSKSDNKCAFTAVNGTANMQFDLPGAIPFAVSFSKLHFEPDGQVSEGKIDVADFNPGAPASDAHTYTLALHEFQFSIHSLHIEPRFANGDVDLIITTAMNLRLPSAGDRIIEGELKCNVRALLGDGLLQASCPLPAAWQVGTTPIYLGDPGSLAVEGRHLQAVRPATKTPSAFAINWPPAASVATGTLAPIQSLRSKTVQTTAVNPAATQSLSSLASQPVASQIVADYEGPVYLKSPFIDKLDSVMVPSSSSLALAPDGIRGDASFANANFAPLFPDSFTLNGCSGQYQISASAIASGTMTGKVTLPGNYWDDNHHAVSGTFNGTLDATGSLSAPVKLLPLSNGGDPKIEWDSFASLPQPPAIRIFLPRAISAASLRTLPQVEPVITAPAGVAPQAAQPAVSPLAVSAIKPADVVAMTQQAAAVSLMTTSQYAARSSQPEIRNYAPALARLEAATVARYSGKASVVRPSQLGDIAQIINQPILWSLLLGQATLSVWGKGHELVDEPTPSYGLQIQNGWLNTPWLGAQDEDDPTKTGASPIFFFNSTGKNDGFVLTATGAYGGMHYEIDRSVEFPAIGFSQYEGFNIEFEDFTLKFARGRLADSQIHASLHIPFGDLEFELVNMEVDPTNDVNFVGGELKVPEKWELGKESPISIVPNVVILKERTIVFDGIFYIALLRNYKNEVQGFTAHQGKILVFRDDSKHQCARLADMNTSADEKETIGGLAATLHDINFDNFVACAGDTSNGWPYMALDTDLVVPGFGKKSVQFHVYDGSADGHSSCGPPPENPHAPASSYHSCIYYATDNSGDFKDTFDLARQMPVGNNVNMVTGISLKLAPSDYTIWRGVSYIDVPQLGLVTGPWSADAVDGKTWQLIPSNPPPPEFGANLPDHSGGSLVAGAHLRFGCDIDYWNNVCKGENQQLDPANPTDPSNWIQFSDDTGITKFGLHGATLMGKADAQGNSTGDVQVPSGDTTIAFNSDTASFSVEGSVPGGTELTPGNQTASSGDTDSYKGKKLTLVNQGGFKLYFDAEDSKLSGSFDNFSTGGSDQDMPTGEPEVGVRFNFWTDGGYFDIGTGIKNIPVFASLKADGALGIFYTEKTEGAYLLGDVNFDWTGAGTGLKGEGHVFVDAFAKVQGTEVKDLMHDLIRKEIVEKLDGLKLWPPNTDEKYFGAGLGVHAELDVLSWDIADIDADLVYEYGDLGSPNYPNGWSCTQCSGFRGYLGVKLDDIVHWRGMAAVLNGNRDVSTTCCDATVVWSDKCKHAGDTGCHGLCSIF